jgi:hypothetical protein
LRRSGIYSSSVIPGKPGIAFTRIANDIALDLITHFTVAVRNANRMNSSWMFSYEPLKVDRNLPSPLRSDETVGGVLDFTPALLTEWIAWKKGSVHWRKPDPHPNRVSAVGKLARDEKLIIAETTVRGLYVMFCGSQFLLWI